MPARARFKKLTDLYVRRREVALPDGSIMHVRALNAFERDECLDAAQIARARLVMALREAGLERLKVEARIAEVGEAEIARELADVHADDELLKIIDGIRDDPDWRERLEILERTDVDDPAHPITDEEQDLLAKINADYFAEVDKRRTDEVQLRLQLHQRMTSAELRDAYLDAWLDKKGRKVANDEFLLTEMQLATCWPDGERVFQSKAEVREAPGELFDAIAKAIAELQMEARDPKDSGSDPTSSASSPQPSEAAASGTSTSTETRTPPPGTSQRPSPTR